MVIAQATPPPTNVARPSTRDTGVDLVRAACVGVVVLLHALMVGVTVGPAGPVFGNAAENSAWLVPVTWVAQVMPVFFVIGGFSGFLAYRRIRASGGAPVGFVTGRVHRLLFPMVVSIGVVGAALTVLVLWGVPAELVQIAGFRYSQPLWFLGVFLLCQALLPALVAAHERAPFATLSGLGVLAVVVDVLRGVSGVEAIGFVNLTFVWLALQQLGFFLAEGRIDALSRRTRGLAGLAAIAGLAGSFAAEIHSPDLLENLNPPTTALLLVGVAQTALLSLTRPALDTISTHPWATAFTSFVTARTMTIYLWHMPVLLAMAGVSAVLAMNDAMVLPEPSSAAWWLTRPLWLAVACSLVAAVALAFASGERRRMPKPTTSAHRAGQAVLLGLAAVVVQLVAGTTVPTAAIAVTLLLGALWCIRASHSAAPASERSRNSASSLPARS